jgi:hypothetical protein
MIDVTRLAGAGQDPIAHMRAEPSKKRIPASRSLRPRSSRWSRPKSTNEKVRYQGSCSSARPTVLGSSTGIGDDLPALAVGDFHEAVERGGVAAAGEDLVPWSNGEIGGGSASSGGCGSYERDRKEGCGTAPSCAFRRLHHGPSRLSRRSQARGWASASSLATSQRSVDRLALSPEHLPR